MLMLRVHQLSMLVDLVVVLEMQLQLVFLVHLGSVTRLHLEVHLMHPLKQLLDMLHFNDLILCWMRIVFSAPQMHVGIHQFN